MKIRKWVGNNSWVWAATGAFVLWMLISVIAGSVSLQTLLLNATLASILALVAFGQMIVITSGDGAIDLSLPYIVTFGGYVAARFMAGGNETILSGFIITILVCAFVGLLNGLITLYLKVPAIITTLATGYILYSFILMIAYNTQAYPNPLIKNFASWKWHDFSTLTMLCLIVAVLLAVVMYRTKFGKRLHAVGQNRRAADLAGINVRRTVIGAFIISGVLGGITGILCGGFFGGTFLDMGNAYLITGIAATLIGGTVVAGGKSSVGGTLAGALMLTLIVTFITLTRLSMGLQYLIEGAVLIAILAVSSGKEDTA